MDDLLVLMQRFRVAYGSADKEGLLALTSDDFQWCQHVAQSTDELPAGRTLQGVDALLDELAWRKQHWQEVRYSDLAERAAGDDLLVQTFTISGLQDGKPFNARAVDPYPVKDGLITRKDTYWKYLK
ncbi:MAG: SnoaL-like domain-containing protein [Gammaproteobacteria bacterium]|nr:SnoaL-like domain-containing protein [Gammaproteobacteria bacterium]